MAHEQELVRPQALPSDEHPGDERWPVPYAVLFIIVASVALWSLIMAAANWLIG